MIEKILTLCDQHLLPVSLTYSCLSNKHGSVINVALNLFFPTSVARMHLVGPAYNYVTLAVAFFHPSEYATFCAPAI